MTKLSILSGRLKAMRQKKISMFRQFKQYSFAVAAMIATVIGNNSQAQGRLLPIGPIDPLPPVSEEILKFSVSEGKFRAEGGFCLGECPVYEGALSGTFEAYFSNGDIYFSASNLESASGFDFQLPGSPNQSANGSVREITFDFDGETLTAQGSENSLAFDGPLVKYKLTAQLIEVVSAVDRVFYSARKDFRECLEPYCGGYFLMPLNDKNASEHYVSEILWASMGLPDYIDPIGYNEEGYLLEGTIVPAKKDIRPTLEPLSIEFDDSYILPLPDMFVPKAVYRPVGDAVKNGRYFSFKNNGILCITSPCFSFDADVINKDRTRAVSHYDFSVMDVSLADLETAQTILANQQPLLVRGNIRTEAFPFGPGKKMTIKRFYLPVKFPLLSYCEMGYELVGGQCKTPYGCVYPQLEVTGIGGVAPPPGFPPNITKFCADECLPPVFPTEPGQCMVAFP